MLECFFTSLNFSVLSWILELLKLFILKVIVFMKSRHCYSDHDVLLPCISFQRFLTIQVIEKGQPMSTSMWTGIRNLNRGRRKSRIRTNKK